MVERLHGMEEVGVRFSLGPHFRKAQGIGSRLASLDGQFVLNLGRKNQLAILQNAVRADIFKCSLAVFAS